MIGKTLQELDYREDRYHGVTIDLSTADQSPSIFGKQLDQLTSVLLDKKLLWLSIPLIHSSLIPVATRRGFRFHQCSETELLLVKKLIPNPTIPTAKNFTVGVGAVVLDGTKILAIKNKHYSGYMLPGGHIDKRETIKNALCREVYEETGVTVSFDSIITLGHFTEGQFGEANLYIVCTALPTSTEITIHDTSEIVEAQWIETEHYLKSPETNPFNKTLVKAALKSSASQLREKEIQLKIPCTYELFL